MTDAILVGMASELRNALVNRGLDPANPPIDSAPPSGTAWREYCARGGEGYDDPDEFMKALIGEVKRA